MPEYGDTLAQSQDLGLLPDSDTLEHCVFLVRAAAAQGSIIEARRELWVDPLGALRVRFSDLAERWHTRTRFVSSSVELTGNEEYLEVIGLGRPAIPLIIDDMKQRGGFWYPALRALTHVDPVAESDRGFVKKMDAAWLRWFERQGSSYLASAVTG